eukprot:CAMPEP_0183345814 /NCGR_PEP_ID=MMETSP0164_2-20130417/11131_1 /TAXON_ID=221442 /ORGANISM="Coccolithus pelagicus ssp braarudi, Strain PLY182g" /LENGTH=156 /DNA_ID=CAMNT_0025517005 /DNA_START=329 /DNA_END=796 /DNA_ORIENTATION=-
MRAVKEESKEMRTSFSLADDQLFATEKVQKGYSMVETPVEAIDVPVLETTHERLTISGTESGTGLCCKLFTIAAFVLAIVVGALSFMLDLGERLAIGAITVGVILCATTTTTRTSNLSVRHIPTNERALSLGVVQGLGAATIDTGATSGAISKSKW